MGHFTKDFTDFLGELEKNNHKPWFDENRKRYEKNVKKPFENLVNDVISGVQKIDERVQIPHKNAIFRISRDIRFAKDKTPYKTNRSAIISPKGTKDKSFPGVYFEVNANEWRIYSGVYMTDAKMLQRIREEIVDHLEPFQKIVTDKDFVATFGTVNGEKSIRIPKEFQEIAKKEPLVANKNWYVYTKLPLTSWYSEDIVDIILAHYAIAKPFNDFLERPVVG